MTDRKLRWSARLTFAAPLLLAGCHDSGDFDADSIIAIIFAAAEAVIAILNAIG